LVYADAVHIGDTAHPTRFMEICPSDGEPTFAALTVERCQIPISTVVVRKRVLVEAGLFDEELIRCDDYDMWVRAALRGAKIGYSRKVQARLFIGRPGSLGQSRARMAEADFIILEKLKKIVPATHPDRQLLERRAEEIRARYLLEEGKCQLQEQHFEKAKELISQANAYLRRPSLNLTLAGLAIAPNATARLVALWTRMRAGATN
jgi:hypothetical protein